ncbi:hypothetical protein [Inquilinus sp. CA228]
MLHLIPEPLLTGLALMGGCLGAWAILVLFVSVFSAPYDPGEEHE